MICFEIAYGDVVEAVVDGGAQVITVQTNNATYQGTAQPEQQLQIEPTVIEITPEDAQPSKPMASNS